MQMVRVAVVLLLMVLAPSAVLAQKGVALVIGNSAYLHTPKLINPKNDAIDISAALEKHGFQVISGFDLDKLAFEKKVRDFAAALQGATAGVFFYAGHGLQVAGLNYLVPIDAQLKTVAALEYEMLRLDAIHRIMERLTRTNVLFLDACRDNPLVRNLALALGTRSVEIGRGLAPVESGFGTLISFSTQPGNVALDGRGRNSPFAGSLAQHVSSSSDDLNSILISVRNDVIKETQGQQVPWEHSALLRRFYFVSSPPVAPPTSAPPAAPAVNSAAQPSPAVSALPAVKSAAPQTPNEPKVAVRNEAIASLHRVIVDKVDAIVPNRDELKGQRLNYKRKVSPKALAACIDWNRTTPTYWASTKGNASQIRTAESKVNPVRSEEQASREAVARCNDFCPRACDLVDVSGRNVLRPPETWLAQRSR